MEESSKPSQIENMVKEGSGTNQTSYTDYESPAWDMNPNMCRRGSSYGNNQPKGLSEGGFIITFALTFAGILGGLGYLIYLASQR